MNVVLVNQYYVPDLAPTGRYLHDLAKALVARGHRVRVQCGRASYDGTQRLVATEMIDGVEVRRGGTARGGPVEKSLAYLSFAIPLTRTLLCARPRPDLVLSLTTPPFVGSLASWAAARRRIPHVQWIMDLYPEVLSAHGLLKTSSLLYAALRRLDMSSMRRTALTIAIGDDMAELIRGRFSDADGDVPLRLKCLPLWANAALADQAADASIALRAARGWQNDVVFTYSGNMGRGHRLEEMLEAARLLQASPPPGARLRFVFAGGGARRKGVEEFALARPGAVDLLPYEPAATLAAHLASADVLLASQEPAWQGCLVPSKIQGAFAVGRPVLFVGGERNGTAGWIRGSGGGWVVPPGDVAALLAAVREATNPDLRAAMGRRAATFARKEFDITRNTEVLCNWIESAARRPDVPE